jgi:hypothetical protein
MKNCKHKFEEHNAFVITRNGKEFPRMSMVCKRCGICIHKPIYSIELLRKVEAENE